MTQAVVEGQAKEAKCGSGLGAALAGMGASIAVQDVPDPVSSSP
jgi:hypothetical protein